MIPLVMIEFAWNSERVCPFPTALLVREEMYFPSTLISV